MQRDAISTGRVGGYSPAFLIALAASAFFFFSIQSMFPVLPRFVADVVLERPPDEVGDAVGLATSVVALIAVLTRIPVGQLADRLGRRRFMLAGAVFFVLSPLIYAASRGMPFFLLGRVVQGFGLVFFSTPFMALIADLSPPERRGEAMGLAGASVSVALIVAPLVGDWMATTWGYSPFFLFSAAVAGVSLFLTAMIGAPSRRTVDLTRSARADLRMVLAQRGVRASVMTMAALGVPFGVFVTFLPLLADERAVTGVGTVFSVYASLVFLSQPLSGWLSDRIGRRGVILPGLVVTGLAVVVFSLDGSLLLFLAAGVLLGVGGGLTRGGVDALAQDDVASELRGTAAAVQYTSFDFWVGMAAYPVGMLANAAGYGAAFVTAGVSCLIGGGIVVLILRGEVVDR